jgi:integrase
VERAGVIDFRKIGASLPRERYSRGSLRKSDAKPQKWLGEWYVYDSDDKRRHKGPVVIGQCSKMSKTEAQVELDKRISESRSSADQKPGGEPTFGWMLKSYIELKSPGWSDAHRDGMKWLAAKHLTPTFGLAPLRSLARVDIQTYLNALASSGASYSLVHKVRTHMKAVLDEAIEQDLLVKNPARKLDVPRTKEKCERHLTEDECQKLLSVCSGRDYVIIRMCMVQGFRPGEIFALKREDIESDRVRIKDSAREGKLQGRVKTRGSKGHVPLPPALGIVLRHWLETSPADPAGLVFPSEKPGVPMRQKNFLRRNLKDAAKRAGLEGVTFQSLRRTTATHVGAVGTVKDAQAVLRHTNPNLTASVYMQSIDESVSRASQSVDERLSGKPTIQ